jgi:hypothetical protein
LDYDNDGNLDILLVGPKIALYKGDGAGHFTDVTRETGLDTLQGHFLGCTVGDYDNDGYPDIYITGFRTGVLLHNERGKAFKDVTVQSGLKPQPWGTSAAFVQLTNSGHLDLCICNYLHFGPDVRPQLCIDHGIPAVCMPKDYLPEHNVLYHNLGNGRFADVTAAWNAAGSGRGLGIACADFDGSGTPSIAFANDQTPGDLLHCLQRGSPRFTNIAQACGTARGPDGQVHAGMGEDWGDYDNDGKLDLVVAAFAAEQKSLYHNEGGNLFSDAGSSTGINGVILTLVTFGCKFFDYDNDGWLDLIFANGHIGDNVAQVSPGVTFRQSTVLLHNGGGSLIQYQDVSQEAGTDVVRPIVGRGLAVGDYDNDGKVDVLIVDSEGSPVLLHNETVGSGHWLQIKLVGTKSNRDGIGSLVTFETGGRKLLRLCHTDGSYMSASDSRVHCGLGDASSANITIKWPSGQHDIFRNVAADRVVVLTEGSSASDK